MENKKLYSLALLSIITAAALWGMQAVILLPHLSDLPVDFVMFFSYFLPFAAMSVLCYKEFYKITTISCKDFAVLAMIAVFGGIIGTMAIVKALFLVNYSNLSVVVLLQKTQPIFAVIMARFFLKEQIDRKFYPWAGLVLVGVYFMTFGLKLPVVSGESSILWAALLALSAAACFASNTVFGRYLSETLSNVTITFYRYGFTALFGFIVMMFLSGFSGFSLMTRDNFYIFILIAVTSGPLSMFMFYFGLKYVKASTSSICEFSLPLTAIILDYLVYGGVLSITQWIGTVVMVLGIYRITKLRIKSD